MPTATMLTHWLDLVGDLLRGPADFPHMLLSRELSAAFSAYAAWSRLEADGSASFASPEAPPGWPDPGLEDYWANEGLPVHPLPRWFATTGDPAATTIARVPRQLVPARSVQLMTSTLRPFDLDRQLSIPVHLTGYSQRAFVLGRGGRDFTEQEVCLARQIQPLLMLLARRAGLSGTPVPRADPAVAGWLPSRRHDPGLLVAASLPKASSTFTTRELAVLRGLAHGLTANAIGHRMGISPRTVHKHLEHLYRKLEVTDRLLAVRVAAELGLLDVRPPPDTGDAVRWSVRTTWPRP